MKSTRGEEEHSQSTRSVQIGWSSGHYSFPVLPRRKCFLQCVFPCKSSSNLGWNKIFFAWSTCCLLVKLLQTANNQLQVYSSPVSSTHWRVLLPAAWCHDDVMLWQHDSLMTRDDKLPWQSLGPWLINIRSPPDDRGKLATPWQNMISSMCC